MWYFFAILVNGIWEDPAVADHDPVFARFDLISKKAGFHTRRVSRYLTWRYSYLCCVPLFIILKCILDFYSVAREGDSLAQMLSDALPKATEGSGPASFGAKIAENMQAFFTALSVDNWIWAGLSVNTFLSFTIGTILTFAPSCCLADYEYVELDDQGFPVQQQLGDDQVVALSSPAEARTSTPDGADRDRASVRKKSLNKLPGAVNFSSSGKNSQVMTASGAGRASKKKNESEEQSYDLSLLTRPKSLEEIEDAQQEAKLQELLTKAAASSEDHSGGENKDSSKSKLKKKIKKSKSKALKKKSNSSTTGQQDEDHPTARPPTQAGVDSEDKFHLFYNDNESPRSAGDHISSESSSSSDDDEDFYRGAITSTRSAAGGVNASALRSAAPGSTMMSMASRGPGGIGSMRAGPGGASARGANYTTPHLSLLRSGGGGLAPGELISITAMEEQETSPEAGGANGANDSLLPVGAGARGNTVDHLVPADGNYNHEVSEQEIAYRTSLIKLLQISQVFIWTSWGMQITFPFLLYILVPFRTWIDVNGLNEVLCEVGTGTLFASPVFMSSNINATLVLAEEKGFFDVDRTKMVMKNTNPPRFDLLGTERKRNTGEDKENDSEETTSAPVDLLEQTWRQESQAEWCVHHKSRWMDHLDGVETDCALSLAATCIAELCIKGSSPVTTAPGSSAAAAPGAATSSPSTTSNPLASPFGAFFDGAVLGDMLPGEASSDTGHCFASREACLDYSNPAIFEAGMAYMETCAKLAYAERMKEGEGEQETENENDPGEAPETTGAVVHAHDHPNGTRESQPIPSQDFSADPPPFGMEHVFEDALRASQYVGSSEVDPNDPNERLHHFATPAEGVAFFPSSSSNAAAASPSAASIESTATIANLQLIPVWMLPAHAVSRKATDAAALAFTESLRKSNYSSYFTEADKQMDTLLANMRMYNNEENYNPDMSEDQDGSSTEMKLRNATELYEAQLRTLEQQIVDAAAEKAKSLVDMLKEKFLAMEDIERGRMEIGGGTAPEIMGMTSAAQEIKKSGLLVTPSPTTVEETSGADHDFYIPFGNFPESSNVMNISDSASHVIRSKHSTAKITPSSPSASNHDEGSTTSLTALDAPDADDEPLHQEAQGGTITIEEATSFLHRGRREDLRPGGEHYLETDPGLSHASSSTLLRGPQSPRQYFNLRGGRSRGKFVQQSSSLSISPDTSEGRRGGLLLRRSRRNYHDGHGHLPITSTTVNGYAGTTSASGSSTIAAAETSAFTSLGAHQVDGAEVLQHSSGARKTVANTLFLQDQEVQLGHAPGGPLTSHVVSGQDYTTKTAQAHDVGAGPVRQQKMLLFPKHYAPPGASAGVTGPRFEEKIILRHGAPSVDLNRRGGGAQSQNVAAAAPPTFSYLDYMTEKRAYAKREMENMYHLMQIQIRQLKSAMLWTLARSDDSIAMALSLMVAGTTFFSLIPIAVPLANGLAEALLNQKAMFPGSQHGSWVLMLCVLISVPLYASGLALLQQFIGGDWVLTAVLLLILIWFLLGAVTAVKLQKTRFDEGDDKERWKMYIIIWFDYGARAVVIILIVSLGFWWAVRAVPEDVEIDVAGMVFGNLTFTKVLSLICDFMVKKIQTAIAATDLMVYAYCKTELWEMMHFAAGSERFSRKLWKREVREVATLMKVPAPSAEDLGIAGFMGPVEHLQHHHHNHDHNQSSSPGVVAGGVAPGTTRGGGETPNKPSETVVHHHHHYYTTTTTTTSGNEEDNIGREGKTTSKLEKVKVLSTTKAASFDLQPVTSSTG
ncbi:unnamed protein product [Amoebophrya sp. A120]|nr:unnamed protein product [Amoebophrya sp. A120]|eukprot:GSA120T00019875001.1